MRFLIVAAILFLMCGCDIRVDLTTPGKPEKVKVVVVQQESISHKENSDVVGSRSAYTVVEFPNGVRSSRNGIWGEVGDEFVAVYSGNSWHSVVEAEIEEVTFE